MFTIEFILPYHKLRTAVEQVFREHPKRDQIKLVITSKTHSEIREGELKGDVIIARGLTAAYMDRLLKSSFIFIELPMSGYDVMKAFHEGLTMYPETKTIGFIATPATIYGFENFIAESNLTIRTYPIDYSSGYEGAVDQAIEDGVDLFIGGDGAASCAISRGFHAVRIDAGRDSVRQAIDEALYIYQTKMEQELRSSRMDAVIESIDEGIITCDGDKNITICNSYAQGVLGKPFQELVGHSISEFGFDVVPFETLSEREEGRFLTLNGSNILLSRTPILVDGVFQSGVIVFQKLSKIQHMERAIRREATKSGLSADHSFKQILGNSRAINEAKELGLSFSKVNANVLLVGDTGTGKELFAQSIHNASDRHSMPFVAVNCAALPETLLESELFGYVSGAFTGASKSGKVGLFELAHTGTIFLDEIGEISLSLQGRLLRVLEEREIMRLGSDKVTAIDVRIIAATNRDLEQLVRENKFRKDLFYRLDVLRLPLPSLAERSEDIPILMESFIERADRKSGLVKHMIDPEVFPFLQSYSWPGNIRQLRNLCERLSAVVFNSIIKLEDVKRCFSSEGSHVHLSGDAMERERLLNALVETQGNRSRAAEKLGIDRTTLYRKLRKYKVLQ